jgi:hypothetical protein
MYLLLSVNHYPSMYYLITIHLCINVSIYLCVYASISGTILFDESTKVCRWTIGKLSHDANPLLTGSIILQPNSTNEAPPIEMNWKVI